MGTRKKIFMQSSSNHWQWPTVLIVLWNEVSFFWVSVELFLKIWVVDVIVHFSLKIIYPTLSETIFIILKVSLSSSLYSVGNPWFFFFFLYCIDFCCCSVWFPCPSLSPGVCSNSCPLSQCCCLTISSLPPSSPFALSLSQHQGLFQGVSSSHQVAKVLELQLQHQSFQWIFRADLL